MIPGDNIDIKGKIVAVRGYIEDHGKNNYSWVIKMVL